MTLRADRVSYAYATGTALAHAALRDVSLDVEPSTTTLIMGNTGSGKSTLLHILAGLFTPGEGAVSIEGKSVGVGQVGMVFQQPESQLFSADIITDVSFGPKNLGASEEEAHARATEALELVGLPPDEFASRSPFSLSGGQARRAAIAGVLAMNTDYVLFDEPTAGLDGAGCDFVCSLIDDLRDRGIGVVVVSHDVDVFLGHADRVVLMDDGAVVWQGAAGLIVGDPHLFERASLSIPDLLAFQSDLGCPCGGYSLDVDEIAAWALGGFSPQGPAGHHHGDADPGDAHHGDGGC